MSHAGGHLLQDKPRMQTRTVSPELQAISDRAYLYAFGIDRAYRHLHETTVEPAYPANRFQIIRHLADETYTAHPTINNDTLHLMGWLDVAAEPVIVSVPDHDDGRYWQLHTMDMGHYTNGLFGKRTRGARGGRFMFANRSWKGEVPDGVTEVIRVERNLLKLMGRVMATGVEDEKKALTYVDDWNIRALSEFLGRNGPRPKVRTFVPPTGNTWLERVNFVLADGTMAPADAHLLEGLDPSGIGAGRARFTPEQLAAAEISERHVVDRLKEVLPTLTNASRSLGTREEVDADDRQRSASPLPGRPSRAAERRWHRDAPTEPRHAGQGRGSQLPAGSRRRLLPRAAHVRRR